MPSQENESSPVFQLYPYALNETGKNISLLIKQGLLPRDIYLRLAAFGHDQPDLDTGQRMTWVLMQDILANIYSPSLLDPLTVELLTSDPPDGVIDWNLRVNTEACASFDHMYYSVDDLATVIEEKNLNEFISSDERSWRARRVAKSLWRIIIARHHPEWLNSPDIYYAPVISFNHVYDNVTERTMTSRIVSHAILSDPLVYGTFLEAQTIGVKGIANKGVESLRLLLSEEHPELNGPA